MKPIQSAGEAVSALRRRDIFRGGLAVALSAPAVALAPAAITGLGSVIAQFSEVKALYEHAVRRVEEISDLSSNPGYPTIISKDLPLGLRLAGHNYEMWTRTAIDAFFDKRERSTEASRKMMGSRWADRHLENYRKVKAGIIEVFEGRVAKRDLWEIETGWKAASAEADRLSDLMSSLDDRILYGPCDTLDDVRLKVAHIKREYGDELSKTASFKVLESLSS